jgi:hypothetical protein
MKKIKDSEFIRQVREIISSKKLHAENLCSYTIHTEIPFNRNCSCKQCVDIKDDEEDIFSKVVTCEDANEMFDPDWFRCPNCLETFNIYGELKHKHLFYN